MIGDSAPSDGAEVSPDDLAVSALFAVVPPEQLAECAARARLATFRRGDLLAREGDPEDDLLVLLSGTVEVVIERAGREEFIGVLGRGDIVGDLALLLERERTATVRALRDCSAARVGAEDFSWLLNTAPTFAAKLARTIATHLERTTHRIARARPVGSVAVVALEEDVAVEASALRAGLAAALPAAAAPESGAIEVLSHDGAGDSDPPAVLAEGDHSLIRQADVVLAVGRTATPAALARLSHLADLASAAQPSTRLELVVLQRGDGPYDGTASWLGDERVNDWHHLPSRSGDVAVARLARRLAGTAVGVVLSGGGARAFAHIGVLRALREAGIAVDVIGGASMGAIVAAQHAAGMTPDEMVARMRAAFVGARGLPDFTLPLVALRTGAGTQRRLTAMFGELRSEDLATTFVCVSSNLVTAESVVHDRGPVWLAVRTSATVPGMLPPMRAGRDALLVDGGLLENLPVAAVRERHAGRIIASDASVRLIPQTPVEAPRRRRPRLPGRHAGMPRIDAILMRTVELASVRDSREAGQPADLYLAPRVDDVAMNQFARIDELVDRGYEAAREALDGWAP